MNIQVIGAFLVVGFISLMITTGLLPEIPRTVKAAIVEFECADIEPCTIDGTLKKSWTGTYTIAVNDKGYFQSHSDDLVSEDGATFRFGAGFLRQYPVVGTLSVTE